MNRTMLLTGFVAAAIGALIGAAIAVVADPNGSRLSAAREAARADHAALQKAVAEVAARDEEISRLNAQLTPKPDEEPTSESEADDEPFKPDPEKQKKRLAFINELKRDGYVAKIERGYSIPNVWVTAKFLSQPFAEKQAACEIIYAYYFPEDEVAEVPRNMLRIKDNISGDTIGTYSPLSGGLNL